MPSLIGWFGVIIGLLVATAGMIQVIQYSPLIGPVVDMESVYLWSVIFLLGTLLSGWGLAKLVTP